ncbi:MAG: cupin domain-containing protein [Halobacteriota archaeon]
MSDKSFFEWGHVDDLPESEFELEETGGWSDRFAWWKQVSDIFGSENLSVTFVALDPGQQTPMHSHEAPTEEYYYVVSGTVDIEVKNPETGEIEVVEGATPGSIAYFPPGVEHRPINNYDERTVELGFRTFKGSLEYLDENINVSDEETGE